MISGKEHDDRMSEVVCNLMDSDSAKMDELEATRAEVRRLREELATVTGQKDARTEEMRLARNYMGALLGIIDGDRERVDSALEVIGCDSRSDLLDEAQAFVSAP